MTICYVEFTLNFLQSYYKLWNIIMPQNNPKFILEQIYNFIVEKPTIDSQSQFMQLKTFLSELHECDKSTFEAIKPYNYKGVFNGKQQTILAHAAPSFLQKKEFLHWMSHQLEQ